MSDDSTTPPKPPRLGRGLAALIGEQGEDVAIARAARSPRVAPIEFVRANPLNPRKTFKDEDLVELTDSIREKGIIQPLIVRAKADLPNVYELIAGERRWRAAQRAGLHEVPIVVVEADDRQAIELAIIENVQRADLNPIEEAAGYEQLIDQFAYTQADLARSVGKSRSHVANTMRLSKLPAAVKAHVISGALSAGHARALLAFPDPDVIAQRALDQGLTVRDLERLSQVAPETKTASVKVKAEKDADTRELEQALRDVIGLDVTIDHRDGKGQMTIRYKTLEQLDALCRRLKH
jgi:ParB family transcriptional regulator, chromosome partitioning protein